MQDESILPLRATLRTAAIAKDYVRKTREAHPEVSERDARLWQKIYEFLDGQTAYVMELGSPISAFLLCGLEDDSQNRELYYLMEQDSQAGCYIGEREAFDIDYDNGEYLTEVTPFFLTHESVEIIG